MIATFAHIICSANHTRVCASIVVVFVVQILSSKNEMIEGIITNGRSFVLCYHSNQNKTANE